MIQPKKQSLEAVMKALRKAHEIAGREFTRTLTRLGEEAVAFARDRSAADSWIDRTGNLRSSVGYGVYNGKAQAAESAFPQVAGGAVGGQVGREFLAKTAEELADPGKVSLIVVAGMDYAADVEAIKTKDVLAGPELFVRGKLPDYMAKTRARIEAKTNELLK